MNTSSGESIRVGFVGYGEAGRSIGGGLAEQPGVSVVVYDPRFVGNPELIPPGATAVGSVEELAAMVEIIFSTVVAAVAVKAAEDVARYLGPSHFYVDLNSVSPATKQQIGDAITATGALFVEGGIMTNVAKERHRVPIFACGPGSGRLSSFANARLGMQIEDLGERLGQASAAKMFRSILVKGLEALFLECFAASGRFGVEDRVLEMVQLGYPGPDWRQWARSFIGRTRDHGARRADEMIEVAATLKEMGIEPFMSSAASHRIKAGAGSLAQANLSKTDDSVKQLAAALAAS